MKLELGKRDLELLVQSLEHCLATCKKKAKDKDAPCEDCDEAGQLKDRLKKAMKEIKA